MRNFLRADDLLFRKLIVDFSHENPRVRNSNLSEFPAVGSKRIAIGLLLCYEDLNFLTIKNIFFSDSYLALLKKRSALDINPPLGGGYIPSRNRDEYFGFGEELYTKIMQTKGITREELGRIQIKLRQDWEIYITLDVDFGKRGIQKLETDFHSYIRDYINNDVVSTQAVNNYSYYHQRQGFMCTIGRLANSLSTAKNITLKMEDVWSEKYGLKTPLHLQALSQSNFLETLFAMEQENLITITHFFNPFAVRVTILPNKFDYKTSDEIKEFKFFAEWLYELVQMDTRAKEQKDEIEQKKQARMIKWGELELDRESGFCSFGENKHKFMSSKPHFKVIEALILAEGEEITHENFFELLAKFDLPQGNKDRRLYINQKVRDIRKALGINRKENRLEDIFFDTGNGYKLQNIELSQK